MANGFDVADDKARSQVDLATVVGLLAGFALVVSAIVLGGSPATFVNVPSVLIVIGGTFAVTTACFSVSEMLQSVRVVGRTMVYARRDPAAAATQVLHLAETSRKQGVLSLQGMLESLSDEPFLHKGIMMVVDGTPGEEVETMLRRDMMATEQRHARSAGILRKAAEFSPAMGLIGTLIGLVQMLGNLDDPTTIGPSMAVALLTTFYGAVLANMVFLPLAAKLERNSAEEALINQVYMLGAASIGRQENPRRLEMMLNSVLPPARRIQYFD